MLKVKYVFDQMLRGTTDTDTTARLDTETKRGVLFPNSTAGEVLDYSQVDASWIGGWENSIQRGVEEGFTNVFLGLVKALVAIQVLIMALLIGILADMLVAMIASALPLFLMLSLLPKVDQVANQMLEGLPALLLMPVLSSVIIVVGAGAIAEAGTGGAVGAGGAEGFGTMYTWITAVGVVFFAITLPLLLVPMLRSVSTMATQVVSSAVSTGAMVTGMAATSAATAAMDSRKAGGGVGAMGLAGAKGLAHGLLGAHGGVGMPNFAGAPDLGTQQAASGIGQGVGTGHGVDPQAAAMMPMQQQQAAVSGALDAQMGAGHTEGNAEALQKAGIGKGWDATKTDKENVDGISQAIKYAQTRQGSLTGDQQDALNAWKGEMAQMMERRENLTNTDIDIMSDMMRREDAKWEEVSDSAMRKGIISRVAAEHGVNAKDVRGWLDSNEPPP